MRGGCAIITLATRASLIDRTTKLHWLLLPSHQPAPTSLVLLHQNINVQCIQQNHSCLYFERNQVSITQNTASKSHFSIKKQLVIGKFVSTSWPHDIQQRHWIYRRIAYYYAWWRQRLRARALKKHVYDFVYTTAGTATAVAVSGVQCRRVRTRWPKNNSYAHCASAPTASIRKTPSLTSVSSASF